MSKDFPSCKFCGSATQLLHSSLPDRIGQASGQWNLYCCTARTCGHIFIEPTPDDATLAAAYRHYYTHSETEPRAGLHVLYRRARSAYLRRCFGYRDNAEPWWIRAAGGLLSWIPHRREAMNSLVLWLPAIPGGQLLEVGCGNGERLALFADLGWQVAGVEPDKVAAALALARGLNVHPGTLESARHAPTQFDAVVMSHVVEHLSDPVLTLREVLRVLKPGGTVTLLTPNTRSLGHLWFGRDWLHLDPPRHIHLFNMDNLYQLCLGAGFASPCGRTTTRDANWTLGASLALKHRGSYILGQLPFAYRLLGLVLHYLELVLLLFQPDRGEEILLTARRPSDTGTATPLRLTDGHDSAQPTLAGI